MVAQARAARDEGSGRGRLASSTKTNSGRASPMRLPGISGLQITRRSVEVSVTPAAREANPDRTVGDTHRGLRNARSALAAERGGASGDGSRIPSPHPAGRAGSG